MKRGMSVWAAAMILLTVLLSGCSSPDGGGLTLTNGVLSWAESSDASYYEVDLGGGAEAVDSTFYNLAARCDYAGEFTVTVRAVSAEGKRTELGSLPVTASSLPLPIIGLSGSGEDVAFVWNTVEGASGYSYDAHDGNGLRPAVPDENGLCRVPVTNMAKQLIRVVANGTSHDNELLLSSESMYQYSSDRVFDLSLLATHPAALTSAGKGGETLTVGTTLPKGTYRVQVSLYVMDSAGRRVSGNGTWGRRITDNEKNIWFCDNELEQWPGSGGTIPYPDTPTTVEALLAVDRGGNMIFPVYDFKSGEMLVVADIVYNGRSVLTANGGIPNPVPETPRLDVSDLDDYLAVFRSPGGGYDVAPDKSVFDIVVPTTLSDGAHTVKVSYYVCTASGDVIEGNGFWGRRISLEDVEAGICVWLNEYTISSKYPGVEVPMPTTLNTSTFAVNVKNGKFKLVGLDFNAGELLLITDVSEVSAKTGNGVYVASGAVNEQFKVKTTLVGDTRLSNVTLSITYKVSDVNGNALSGNGAWGRRIVDAANEHWLTADGVEGHDDSVRTLPAAGVSVTQDFFIGEITKKGVLTLQMYDFLPNEMVEITSIRYNGEEVLI